MTGELETVLVAGASGRTGRELLNVLGETDLAVRAMTRSADQRDRLVGLGADEVVVGDLMAAGDAARAVRGCDAVLCAVGSSPGLGLLGGLVDGRGVRHLVDAAVAADVEAFVLESAIGVGDSSEMMPTAFRVAIWPILRAKNRAESALRVSGLPYTILRPGRLTNAPPTRDVLVGEGGETVSGSIPRADVARLMVAALYTPAAHGRTLEIVARDGLRGRARGLVDLDWSFPWEERVTVEVEEQAAGSTGGTTEETVEE